MRRLPLHVSRTAVSLLTIALGVGASASVGATAGAQPVRKDAATNVASGVAGAVMPGIEVLLRDSLHLLRGKRVGLITNPSGRDRAGRSTIDLLYRAPGVKLVALFGAEHGLRGAAEAGVQIASTTDSATGLPIYSLFGATHVPTPAMLANIDVLVYDIQDVGARVYTYQWTMALAADSSNKPFIVLDRPDPIRADRVEGGVLDPKFASFVGQYPVAMRYGLTPGELLKYLAGTGKITAEVHVVPMAGYRRSMWWEDTGLAWINPSPNLRDVDAELVYTGTVFFEGTNLSEGRGTDQPFRLVGAPWLTDAGAIAAELNARGIAGVRFDSTSRTIAAGQKHGGLTIPMIHVTVTNRDQVNASEVGLRMLRAIYARHKSDFQWRVGSADRLAGSDRMRAAIENDTVDALLETLGEESARFAAETRPYQIYR
jgi:uncharacterized protein YbbC (DUF1343 family)